MHLGSLGAGQFFQGLASWHHGVGITSSGALLLPMNVSPQGKIATAAIQDMNIVREVLPQLKQLGQQVYQAATVLARDTRPEALVGKFNAWIESPQGHFHFFGTDAGSPWTQSISVRPNLLRPAGALADNAIPGVTLTFSALATFVPQVDTMLKLFQVHYRRVKSELRPLGFMSFVKWTSPLLELSAELYFNAALDSSVGRARTSYRLSATDRDLLSVHISATPDEGMQRHCIPAVMEHIRHRSEGVRTELFHSIVMR